MMTTNYVLKHENGEWMANVLINEAGLVMIYGHSFGSYGHFWAGEMAFGKNGIKRFLVGVSEDYAADTFTMFVRDNEAKFQGRQFVRRLWPLLMKQLRDELTGTNAIPADHGDHMTFGKFVQECNDDMFIDYDGFGKYASATHMTDITVSPSEIKSGTYRRGYTHVVWFNR